MAAAEKAAAEMAAAEKAVARLAVAVVAAVAMGSLAARVSWEVVLAAPAAARVAVAADCSHSVC